ncbi:MAG: 2-C-methyl-D-erythritol 4-phosphate cytidylyltransferase [Actinomycetota bacterium]|nr:2-C-methyl-D-erythritol 4-phosphate cytidylyltransferase [Actinomycetota bacterium]
MPVWGIVVAAGRASRFGRPKLLERLGDRRVLDWSLGAARAACDGVVLVVPAGLADDQQLEAGWLAADIVVEGAETRTGSVRRGLAVVPADADVVAVHDAARPLATAELFASAVQAVRSGADGAVCAVPIDDTVKRVHAGTVAETLDRSALWVVQTPQAFDAAVLRAAHDGESDATDDATLVEGRGGRVVVVPGDVRNVKITRPEDLPMADALLAPVTYARSVRVGHGFDVHHFSHEPERVLVLGGVALEGERGLAGHSDADALAHAAAEALLGAAGLGDLGRHFPDTEAEWAGADSMVLLAEVSALVAEAGWHPANVDCTVVLEAPRLAPHRDAMEARLGQAVGAPVSVKATRPEGLGALGRNEGIACFAVALLEAR